MQSSDMLHFPGALYKKILSDYDLIEAFSLRFDDIMEKRVESRVHDR